MCISANTGILTTPHLDHLFWCFITATPPFLTLIFWENPSVVGVYFLTGTSGTRLFQGHTFKRKQNGPTTATTTATTTHDSTTDEPSTTHDPATMYHQGHHQGHNPPHRAPILDSCTHGTSQWHQASSGGADTRDDNTAGSCMCHQRRNGSRCSTKDQAGSCHTQGGSKTQWCSCESPATRSPATRSPSTSSRLHPRSRHSSHHHSHSLRPSSRPPGTLSRCSCHCTQSRHT
jgi:hypothetical protein